MTSERIDTFRKYLDQATITPYAIREFIAGIKTTGREFLEAIGDKPLDASAPRDDLLQRLADKDASGFLAVSDGLLIADVVNLIRRWPEYRDAERFNRGSLVHADATAEEINSLAENAFVALPREFIDFVFDEYGVMLYGTHQFTPEFQPWIHRAKGGEPGMVAYVTTPENHRADRWIRSRMGKALRKLHGPDGVFSQKLSDNDIAAIAGRWNQFCDQTTKFGIAETREDIRTVYENGPNSCMGHSADSYHCSGIHPTEVYAGPDTGVAYMTRGGRYTARGVVNKIDKVYGRMYGHSEPLEEWLKDDGYRFSYEPLAECRLLRIDSSDGLVAPYVDGELTSARDDGKYLVICEDGELSLTELTGLAVPACHCDCCGDNMDPEYTYHAHDEELCEACFNNNYTYDYNGDVIAQDDAVWSEHYDAVIHHDDAVQCIVRMSLTSFVWDYVCHHDTVYSEHYEAAILNNVAFECDNGDYVHEDDEEAIAELSEGEEAAD